MAGIERDGDVIVLQLAAGERPILASLAASLVEMLAPDDDDGDAAAGQTEPDPLAALVGMGSDGPVAAPEDPALRRLLPDAYDDPDGAAEFRRLTDTALRAEKVANLRR